MILNSINSEVNSDINSEVVLRRINNNIYFHLESFIGVCSICCSGTHSCSGTDTYTGTHIQSGTDSHLGSHVHSGTVIYSGTDSHTQDPIHTVWGCPFTP